MRINISLEPGLTRVSSLWEFKNVVFIELGGKNGTNKQTKTLAARVGNLGIGLLLWGISTQLLKHTLNNDHMDLHTLAEPARVKPRLSSFVYRIDQEVLVGK